MNQLGGVSPTKIASALVDVGEFIQVNPLYGDGDCAVKISNYLNEN